MKQYITKKQWDELNVEKKKLFCKFFNWNYKIYEKFQGYDEIGIGQMIEFLGEGWHGWNKIVVKDIFYDSNTGNLSWKFIKNEDLCDKLFEEVKYKLKNEYKIERSD